MTRAGRPRTETGADSPELRCRVPAEVRAALVALAKEQGRPLAAVVLDACRAYLREWCDEDR